MIGWGAPEHGLRAAVLGDFLILLSAVVVPASTIAIVFRSASSRVFIKRLDLLIFLLYIPKADWTYDLLINNRKSLKLVDIYTSRKKLIALDIHSGLSPQHIVRAYTASHDGDESTKFASS